MSIVVEAIYEAGILRLPKPLPELPDHTKVRLTIEPEITKEKATDALRFPAELLIRLDHRRNTVFQRCGVLSDSNDLIREDPL
jgi:predicted DNA-binding antitoxin AbrB/MazE fold protein